MTQSQLSITFPNSNQSTASDQPIVKEPAKETWEQESHCTKCKGTGTRFSPGFTYEGSTYPDETKACYACCGKGSFPPVNIPLILSAIKVSKGKNKGGLKASMTSPLRDGGVEGSRAYFVWRMARFHGGKDMTMPMVAQMVINGDPHVKFLDELADEIAKKVFGTDLAAAARWAKAFGMI